jgi:flagellin-like hook-associated protein FlgL
VEDASTFSQGQKVILTDNDGGTQTTYVENVDTTNDTVDVDADPAGSSNIDTIESAGDYASPSQTTDDVDQFDGSNTSGWVDVDDTSAFEAGDTVTMAAQASDGSVNVSDTSVTVQGVNEDMGRIYLEGVNPDFSTPGATAAQTSITVNEGGTGSSGLGLAATDITTQSNAQEALTKIDSAIQTKDKARAHFGAMMNRLKNTVRAQNIQREKLQAAEAQISDVDVAKETAQLSRNRVLAQAGISMLSQANSMPQMAQSLLRG